MKTYLDGTPLSDAPASLAGALAAARAQCGNRLVIEVTADGQPVPGEHLETPPSHEPYAQELHLTSAPAGALLGESLLQGVEALELIQQKQTIVAEAIQEGDIERSMNNLSAVLEVWAGVRTLVEMAAEVPGMPIDRDALAAAATQLGTILSELKQALSLQDWPTVADLMSYDLPPLADQWREFLQRAASAAASC